MLWRRTRNRHDHRTNRLNLAGIIRRRSIPPEPLGDPPGRPRDGSNPDRVTGPRSAVDILVIAIALVTTGVACGPRSSHSSAVTDGSTANATVEEVIDGDTIIVRSQGDRERVRLIGIDTPETVHPTKPVECFGPEASTHTEELLPRGTPVLLVRDVEPRDRYGRLLAYVYRSSDGLLVNLDLVLGGYATSYEFPPNDTLRAQFTRAEAIARSSGSGMWSLCLDDVAG